MVRIEKKSVEIGSIWFTINPHSCSSCLVIQVGGDRSRNNKRAKYRQAGNECHLFVYFVIYFVLRRNCSSASLDSKSRRRPSIFFTSFTVNLQLIGLELLPQSSCISEG